MKQRIYQDALARLKKNEQLITMSSSKIIEESYAMTLLLKNLLAELKELVLVSGFTDAQEEITFFKVVKPQILGKLIFYNKIYRMETSCPVRNGKLFIKYFSSQLEQLKLIYKNYTGSSEFYRYYKSGRTDSDEQYFRLGNIDFLDGLNSVVFEIDLQFSTYYDYKVSRIISDDLLYQYLLRRLQPDDSEDVGSQVGIGSYQKDIFWTDSKNALIELVYALHATGAISNGRIGITKIALLFENVFRVKLGDLHHSFHRMKDRSGSKTSFMDQMTNNLEKYMNRELD